MPHRRDPVPRARSAGHWLGGILVLGLLAGGVVVAAVLLWENLDVRQLAPGLAPEPGPIPEADPPVSPAAQSGGFSAALFRSEANRRFFPDESYYPRALRRWAGLVEELGGDVREIGTAQELRALDSETLLVLPAAPCLSTEELSAAQAHVNSGGGLVSNWAVGARDEGCAWRGWGTISEITDALDVRELAQREALYLTIPGGLALSPGLDPGTRIELRPEPSLALHRSGPRVYWSDWALNPAPDESGGGADVAAVTIRTPSEGRIAWFGFRLSQAATPRDSLMVDRLVKNGLLWAAGRMQASPSPWPEGRRAALVVIQDVEAEYQNASAAAELLSETRLPGTFFAVSRLVMDDPELGRVLVEAGEVGSQTSDHAPLAGLTLQDQQVRLRRSWSEIRGWTGVSPRGLRPPEEAFDTNTLEAWQEAGGTYVLAVNQARSGSPEIYGLGGGEPMILLPRLIKDDYNVFVQEGALRAHRLAEAFLDGTQKLRAIGGLAVVAVHTQIVGTGGRLNALRDLAESVRGDGDWWLAEAGEVADWWKARHAVVVRAEEGEGGTLLPDTISSDSISSDSVAVAPARFRVEAPGSHGMEGLWVDVVAPRGVEGLMPSVDGVPVAYTETEWGMRIPLGSMAPGEVRVISFPPSPLEEDSSGG